MSGGGAAVSSGGRRAGGGLEKKHGGRSRKDARSMLDCNRSRASREDARRFLKLFLSTMSHTLPSKRLSRKEARTTQILSHPQNDCLEKKHDKHKSFQNTVTTCLADKTNHPVERLSLNRSQCGSCSTKYDTLAGT